MSHLTLTPDIIRAAYDLLNECPPFNKWNLPAGEDIVFHVAKTRATYGRHWHDGNRHHLEVSSGTVGSLGLLIQTVGHEIIHVHELESGAHKSGVEHTAAFKKWAARVCKIHNFDPKAF